MHDLAPLTKSPSVLHYASYDDVRNLVSPESLDKAETDMIREYDSRKSSAQVVFLGMDESADARGDDGARLTWRVYAGRPYFAVDVTPRGSEEQRACAEELVRRMEGAGLSFLRTRMISSFPADQGVYLLCIYWSMFWGVSLSLTFAVVVTFSCHFRAIPLPTRLE